MTSMLCDWYSGFPPLHREPTKCLKGACPCLLQDHSVFKMFGFPFIESSFSFTPFPYKLGLIRTLVHRTFKINNTWIGFHNNIKELTNVLGKNQFPSSLVNKPVKHYLSNFFAQTTRTFAATSSNVSRTFYYKLPFVAPFSTYA